MFNNESLNINKEYILSKITEEQIFIKYLNLEPSDSGLYTNPLRDDKHPSCSFYIDSRGHWKFKDFAYKWNWDCFNVVEYYYNCIFKEALIRIAVDFSLISGSKVDIQFNKTESKPKITGLRIKRRNWYKEDYAFWLQFGITPSTLHYFNVFPISNAWFVQNSVLTSCYFYTKEDICFAYHFNNYDYKLYFPNRAKGRFIQLRSDIQQGWGQLPTFGKYLLHTKSMKDVMALYEFGINAIASMSETIRITKEQFIDVYNRFDNHYSLFDFDRTGITLAREYEQLYGVKPLFFGKEYKGGNFVKSSNSIKDFAEYVKFKGRDKAKQLIENVMKIYE